LAFGSKSKSFLAGEGACAPQSKKQLAIGNQPKQKSKSKSNQHLAIRQTESN
jgi:hypothetical protein